MPTSSRSDSAASLIRRRVEAGGENYWKPSDFPEAPITAVTKTLSRLAQSGVLQRVSKGLYYHPRPTIFGVSQPYSDAILVHRLTRPLLPAGMTAANFLSFSTQNPGCREYATTASSVAFATKWLRVTTRRPEAWNKLSSEDAALLDLIRRRADHSELSAKRTKERLLKLLSAPGRFDLFIAVASTEPPRVRAILGAIGQEMGVPDTVLAELRNGLNRRSRFDFGVLRVLTYASEWQAR